MSCISENFLLKYTNPDNYIFLSSIFLFPANKFSQDNAQHSMQKLVSELFGNTHMETLHLRRLQKCQDKIMNYVILETLCIHQPPVIFLSEKDKEPLHSLKRSHSSLLSLSEVHVSVGKHSHNVLKYVFTLHRNLKTLKTDTYYNTLNSSKYFLCFALNYILTSSENRRYTVIENHSVCHKKDTYSTIHSLEFL